MGSFGGVGKYTALCDYDTLTRRETLRVINQGSIGVNRIMNLIYVCRKLHVSRKDPGSGLTVNNQIHPRIPHTVRW